AGTAPVGTALRAVLPSRPPSRPSEPSAVPSLRLSDPSRARPSGRGRQVWRKEKDGSESRPYRAVSTWCIVPRMHRRDFLSSTAAAAAAASLSPSWASLLHAQTPARPRRYAIVGTGSRGSSMWGRGVKEKWGDAVEFVGLCDPNG